ncbi:hypothetical protein [Methanogenium cariaci]|uniref:hypothetical protein n=1 Tax=Methanogenium cariaci TaxID=2197 RepID=UPI0007830D4C|nr:hypothetical protein [Methanogenium cariaci]
MKKLFVALLVAALCMVAPAVALEWSDLPTGDLVLIDGMYPPGELCGTYFDVYLFEDDVYPPDGVLIRWALQSRMNGTKPAFLPPSEYPKSGTW